MIYGYVKVACETYIHFLEKGELTDELKLSLEAVVSVRKALDIVRYPGMPIKFRGLYLKFINRVYLSQMNLTTITNLIVQQDGHIKQKETRFFSKQEFAAVYFNDDFLKSQEEGIRTYRSLCLSLIPHIMGSSAGAEDYTLQDLKYVYRACELLKQGFMYGCFQFFEVQYCFNVVIGLLNHRNELSKSKNEAKAKHQGNKFLNKAFKKKVYDSEPLTWIKIEVELFSILELCSHYREFFFRMLLHKYFYKFRQPSTILIEKCKDLFKILDLVEFVAKKKSSHKAYKASPSIIRTLDPFHPASEETPSDGSHRSIKRNLSKEATKHSQQSNQALVSLHDNSRIDDNYNIESSRFLQVSSVIDAKRKRGSIFENFVVPGNELSSERLKPADAGAKAIKPFAWAAYDKIFLDYNEINLSTKKELLAPDKAAMLAKNANNYKNLFIKMRRAQIKSLNVFLVHSSHRKKILCMMNSLFGSPPSFITDDRLKRGNQISAEEFSRPALGARKRSPEEGHHERIVKLKKRLDAARATSPIMNIPDILFYYIHKFEDLPTESYLDECFDVLIQAFAEFEDKKFFSDKFYDLQTYLRAHSFPLIFQSLQNRPVKSTSQTLLEKFLKILEFYVKDNYRNQKQCWSICPDLIRLISELGLSAAQIVISIVKSHKNLEEVCAVIKSVFAEIERIYTSEAINLDLYEDRYRQLIEVVSGVAFTHSKYNMSIASFVYELLGQNAVMADLLNMKISLKLFGEENARRNSPLLFLIFDLAKVSPANLLSISKKASCDSISSNIRKYADDFPLKLAFMEFYTDCYLWQTPDNFENTHFVFMLNHVIMSDIEKLIKTFSSRLKYSTANDPGSYMTSQEPQRVLIKVTDADVIAGGHEGKYKVAFHKKGPRNLSEKRSADRAKEMLGYCFQERHSRIAGLFVTLNNVLEIIKKCVTSAVESNDNSLKESLGTKIEQIKICDLKAKFDTLVKLTDLINQMESYLIPGSMSHIQFSILLGEVGANFDLLTTDQAPSPNQILESQEFSPRPQPDSKRTSKVLPSSGLVHQSTEKEFQFICRKLRTTIFANQTSLQYLLSSFMFQSKGEFNEKLDSLLSMIDCPEKSKAVMSEMDALNNSSEGPSAYVKYHQPAGELSFKFTELLIRTLCSLSDYQCELPVSDSSPYSHRLLRNSFIESEQNSEERFFALERYKELLSSAQNFFGKDETPVQRASRIEKNSFLVLFSNFVPKDPRIIASAKSIEAPFFFLSLKEIALKKQIDCLRGLEEKEREEESTIAPISIEIVRTIVAYFIHSTSKKLLNLCLKIFFEYSKLKVKEFMSTLFNVLCSDPFLFVEFLQRVNCLLGQSGLNYYGDILNADRNRTFSCSLSVERKRLEKSRERLKNILHLMYLIFSWKQSIDPKVLRIIDKNNAEAEMAIYKTTASIFLKINEILCQGIHFDYTKLDKKIIMRIYTILEISLKTTTWNIYLLWRSFNNYIAQLTNIGRMDFAVVKENYFYCIYTGLLVKLISLLSVSIKESSQKSSHSISVRDYDCFINLCENIYQLVIHPKKKLFVRDKLCSLSKKDDKKRGLKCTFDCCTESFVSLNDYSLYQTAFKSYLAYKEILGETGERDLFWKQQVAAEPAGRKIDTSFDYFKQSEVKIEICLKNTLIEYSFQKQLICFHFDKILKAKFLARLSKTRSHDDYRLILDEIPSYFEEMILSEKFSNNHLMKFAVHYTDVLALVIYIVALFINIFLLVFVKVVDDSKVADVNTSKFIFYIFNSIDDNNLIIVYIVFGVLVLLLALYDLVSKFILSWHKSTIYKNEFASMYALKQSSKSLHILYENSLDKISLKIRKKLFDVISKLGTRHPTFQKLMNIFSFKNVYAIFFSVVIFLSIIYPFLWPFILLDIFRINPGLNSMLRTFKYNLANLLKVIWVCVIVMYIYATIIFTFFNEGSTADASKSTVSFFAQLSNCFYQTVVNGLVLRGGIGEQLGEINVNNSNFWRRFLLDLSFFFIILVLVLNTLYAIIIETFFIFSRKLRSKTKTQEKVCYICLRNQHELKLLDEDFADHVKNKHNAQNYFFLFVNLFIVKSSTSNSIERVLEKMVFEKDFSFIPMKPKPKFN